VTPCDSAENTIHTVNSLRNSGSRSDQGPWDDHKFAAEDADLADDAEICAHCRVLQ
jgi:hypothetical protein